MVNWISQAKKSAAPAIGRIKQYIMKSSVVGFDESGCYCNKRLDWAWIAQTVYFTLVFRGNGRSSKELESRFGESLKRMTAVTDRHSALRITLPQPSSLSGTSASRAAIL